MEILHSSITGNYTTFGYGGGIAGSTQTITNCTISGNIGFYGGGVAGGGNISHTTFSNNSSPQGGSIYAFIYALELGNNILKASTSSTNIFNDGTTILSHGYNLSNDNGGGFLTGDGDQINTDPLLGPLQNNGGSTFTHELLTGSPAINAGDPNFTPPPFYDQRSIGYLRVYNGRIDIGSFEAQPVPTVSPTPTATATATLPIPTPTPTPCLPVITQSTSQAITNGNSASCNDGTAHTDNSYWRAFDMVAYANGGQYVVNSVSFGVEFANGSQPVTVRLYTTSDFPSGFPGSLTQIGTTTTNVGSAQNGTVVTTPLVATVPAGTPQLVMELFTPNGQPGGYRFFVGSNAALETGPSYFSAPACGITTPATTAASGFPDMHIVFNVNGGCTGAPTPSATPSTTPTPGPSTAPPAEALNLSARMLVQTDDNAGIGGFILTGTGQTRVVVRGIGPSLTQFGVPNALADPTLELYGPGGLIGSNDNWRDGYCGCHIAGACMGPFPTNDLESSICMTLNPGPYTAIIRGKDGTSGIGLVEVYNNGGTFPNPPAKLANLSTRAFVGTDSDIVIAGFILGGNTGNDNVILRGIGPSLTQFGVPNALVNPTLELRDGDGALIRANNDWQDDPAQATIISAAGLAPTNALESAIAATLPPGQYNALLAGLDNGIGVGLVEVYDRGRP